MQQKWENRCDNDVTCFDIASICKRRQMEMSALSKLEWKDMGLTWSLERHSRVCPEPINSFLRPRTFSATSFSPPPPSSIFQYGRKKAETNGGVLRRELGCKTRFSLEKTGKESPRVNNFYVRALWVRALHEFPLSKAQNNNVCTRRVKYARPRKTIYYWKAK